MTHSPDSEALAERLERAAEFTEADFDVCPAEDLRQAASLIRSQAEELEAAESRASALEAELERVKAAVRPITMQDVRLAVGEGKLTAADILAGCNAELRRRSYHVTPIQQGGEE